MQKAWKRKVRSMYRLSIFSQKQEKSGILSKNSKCDIIHRRKTKRRKIMQKAWKRKVRSMYRLSFCF